MIIFLVLMVARSPDGRQVSLHSLTTPLPGVLLVADILRPFHRLAVEPFLQGDVGSDGRGRRSLPALLARCKPDAVAGMDFLDGTAPSLLWGTPVDQYFTQ
jgi:hypothetical protein